MLGAWLVMGRGRVEKRRGIVDKERNKRVSRVIEKLLWKVQIRPKGFRDFIKMSLSQWVWAHRWVLSQDGFNDMNAYDEN